MENILFAILMGAIVIILILIVQFFRILFGSHIDKEDIKEISDKRSERYDVKKTSEGLERTKDE